MQAVTRKKKKKAAVARLLSDKMDFKTKIATGGNKRTFL